MTDYEHFEIDYLGETDEIQFKYIEIDEVFVYYTNPCGRGSSFYTIYVKTSKNYAMVLTSTIEDSTTYYLPGHKEEISDYKYINRLPKNIQAMWKEE